ncbi:MAG: hypothetical protein GY944_15890, partial [bacterium]|nr:hypothetical protein [bacterium]
MNTTIALGLVLGLGLLLTLTGLFPVRLPLAAAIARPGQPRSGRDSTADTYSLWTRLIGAPVAATSIGTSVEDRLSTDIRICNSDSATLISKIALAGLVGLTWAPAVSGLMLVGGVNVSWEFPAWASIALGITGCAVPVAALKAEAARRRRAFRHALSCYLDLVAVRLAGGAGVDGALSQSASAGSGWVFAELRFALDEARLMGEPPWT